MIRPQKPTESPYTSLVLAGIAFVLSLILRQIPVLGWLVYPFQLIVTLVHELSHGLAALATGGRFIEFTMSPDASGLATTAGGWRWFIIPAGYLGAALFGGLMLILINRSTGTHARRWLAIGLGVLFALMTVLFARNATAIGVGAIASLALFLLGVYGTPLLVLFGLNFLAIQAVLNSVDSLLGLMRLNSGPFKLPNDAQSMSELTHVPAVAWAILWSLAALVILIGSVYVAGGRGDGR
jgi:hypothetical protein